MIGRMFFPSRQNGNGIFKKAWQYVAPFVALFVSVIGLVLELAGYPLTLAQWAQTLLAAGCVALFISSLLATTFPFSEEDYDKWENELWDE